MKKIEKKYIDNILAANWYLTKCKLENSNFSDLTQKYLSIKIAYVLNKIKSESTYCSICEREYYN